MIREALVGAGASLDEIDSVAVTAGPGLIGALLVGVAAAKALAWSRGLPLVAGQPPARPRRLALPAAARPRAAVHLPARERRPHAAARRPRPRAGRTSRVLGRTLDDAAGEAFDKGARLLGLAAIPGGAEIDRLARDGDPDAYRLPGRARARARLLVLRAEDRAALRRARPRARRSSRRAGPISPRATSGRSSARSSSGSRRPAASRVAIVGGVAANSELRAALPRRRRRAARALHRQRRDDRLGRPVHRSRPARGVPCARCVCFDALSSASSFSLRSRPGRGSPSAPTRAGSRSRPAPSAGHVARARRRRRIRRSSLGRRDDRRPADAVGRPAARQGRLRDRGGRARAGRPRPSPPSSRC